MALLSRTAPIFQSTQLLDQVRERARYLHHSLRTEKAYVYWILYFVRWHALRHPRDMGAPEVQAFLTMLASERHVSSSTHNQALSAVLSSIARCSAPSCHGCRRSAVRAIHVAFPQCSRRRKSA